MKVQLLKEKKEFKPVSFKITFESMNELKDACHHLQKLETLGNLYNVLSDYLFFVLGVR